MTLASRSRRAWGPVEGKWGGSHHGGEGAPLPEAVGHLSPLTHPCSVLPFRSLEPWPWRLPLRLSPRLPRAEPRVSRAVRSPSLGLPGGGWRAHLHSRGQCSGSRWEGGGTPPRGAASRWVTTLPASAKPDRSLERKQEVGSILAVPAKNPAPREGWGLSLAEVESCCSLPSKPRQGGLHAGL